MVSFLACAKASALRKTDSEFIFTSTVFPRHVILVGLDISANVRMPDLEMELYKVPFDEDEKAEWTNLEHISWPFSTAFSSDVPLQLDSTVHERLFDLLV